MQGRFIMQLRSLVCAWVLACMAQVSQAGLILNTTDVEQAVARGAVLWDARAPADYAQGHLPGAINIGAVGDVFRDPHREDPPSAAVASQLFGRAGLDILQREVVVYATQGDPYAYFAARMIEYYGGTHAKVYHGGIDAWKAAGKPLSQQATTLPPVALQLSQERVGTLWTHDVIERVRSGGSQIVDTRTPKEFTGEDIRAIRGGHIRGAISIPYESNWVDPAAAVKLASRQVSHREGMALKQQDDLRALYSKLDPDKETVVYCQSGVRASETAVILRDLGFTRVKVYEPSWLGYAGVLNAPAENEVFVNVGALNGQISALQGKLRALEAEIGKLQAARQ
jgi:thiosulfate/3-mercaptopyruvate sulfurtransferase